MKPSGVDFHLLAAVASRHLERGTPCMDALALARATDARGDWDYAVRLMLALPGDALTKLLADYGIEYGRRYVARAVALAGAETEGNA